MLKGSSAWEETLKHDETPGEPLPPPANHQQINYPHDKEDKVVTLAAKKRRALSPAAVKRGISA